MRQPDAFGLDAVPTYCQDTVFPWPGASRPTVEELRAAGRRIAGVVLDSARLDPMHREASVRGAVAPSDGEFGSGPV